MSCYSDERLCILLFYNGYIHVFNFLTLFPTSKYQLQHLTFISSDSAAHAFLDQIVLKEAMVAIATRCLGSEKEAIVQSMSSTESSSYINALRIACTQSKYIALSQHVIFFLSCNEIVVAMVIEIVKNVKYKPVGDYCSALNNIKSL